MKTDLTKIMTIKKWPFICLISVLSALIISPSLLFAQPPDASDNLPSGEKIVSGDVTLDRSIENILNVNIASQNAIVEWNNFSVGSGYTMNFNFNIAQPSLGSILNNVTGPNISVINGAINSNGTVFLVNPNGIVIGEAARIDCASMIASTLKIDYDNFLNPVNGRYKFYKDGGNGFIINAGRIAAQPGGYIALLSQAIDNSGTIAVASIDAKVGRIVLASGERMTVAMDERSLISVAIEEGVKSAIFGPDGAEMKSAIKNSGTLLADGGRITLTAKSMNKVFDYAVNNSGIIQANSVVKNNGVIEFVVEGAPIVNTGRIEAGKVTINTIDTDLLNFGEIISHNPADMPEKGSIYINALNILQDGLISSNGLVVIDVNDMNTTQVIVYDPAAVAQDPNAATLPTAVIQGNEVRINFRKLGSTDRPIQIKAPTTYICRKEGDIDISDSLGLGTSILMRGPPESDFSIIYSKDTNLTLDAAHVTVVGADPTHFYGNITFSNLYCAVPGKTIYFEAGKTYTILGEFKVQGTEGGLIKLLSSQEGVQWYIDPQGPRDLTYIWVKDSYNLNPDKIMMTQSTNRGNCFNWDDVATWTGLGANNNWTTAANWLRNGVAAAPLAGDDLVFPDGAARLSNTNNFGIGTDFASIQFTGTGGGYTLNGNRIALGTGDITSGNTSGTNTINLNVSMAAGRTVTVAAGGTLSISGVISGAGSLTKDGAGTLVLSDSNTYTGATTISAGTLRYGANNALSNSTAVTIDDGATLDLNNFSDTVGSIAGSGNITLGSGTLTAGADDTSTTFSGVISGSGGLTKSGTGTLTLSAFNTYTGVTTISAGTLSVSTLAGGGSNSNIGASTNAAANLVINGGTLLYTGPAVSTDRLFTIGTLDGAIDASGTGTLTFTNTGSMATTGTTGARTLTLTGSSNGSLAPVIVNQGTNATSLTKSGTGTWTLSGANTYTGVTTISGGTLSVSTLADGGSNSNIGASTNAAAKLVINGGTLFYTGPAVSTDRLFTLGVSGGTIDASGTGTLAFTNTGSMARSGAGTRTLTLTGSNNGSLALVIANQSGNATSLTKSGTGTWTLSGANTYSGATAISAGTLQYGDDNVLANSTAVTINGGATFDLNNFSDTVGSIAGSGNITLGSGTLTAGADDTSTTFSGVIAGSGGFTKSGAGTLILNGANIYTGLTTIDAGTLAYGANDVISTGNIIVDGGTLDIAAYTDTVGTVTLISGTITGSTGVLTSTADYAVRSGTISAILAGAVGLIKTTTGTVTITSANQFTGAVDVNAGVLNIRNDLALGTAAGGITVTSGEALELQGGITITGEALTLNGTGVSNGGALRNISGNNTWTGNVTLNDNTRINSDADTLTISSGITGATRNLTAGGAGDTSISGIIDTTTGTLTKNGAGTLTLSGANTYTGLTTISAGTLAYGANNVISTGGITVNSGTLDISVYSDTVGTVTLTNGGTITGTTGILTSTDDYDVRNGTISAILAGAVGLTKTTTGTVTLSGANIYSGGAALSAGTLNINNASALGTGTFTITGGTIDNTSGGEIIVTTNNAQAWNGNFAFTGTNDLNLGTGAVNIDDATRTVTVNGGNLTVGGTIGPAAPARGLTKNGTGILTLSGANTYTGATTLNAGTLNINNASALGAGAFNVAIGTTVNYGASGDQVIRQATYYNLGTSGSGAKTLEGDISIGGDLTVGNGTNLDGAHNLTVNGNAIFDGTVGSGTALSSLHVLGTTSINALSIDTTGAQAYDLAVTLGSDTTLTGLTVTFDDILDGGYDLIINDSGTTTFNGEVGRNTPLTSLDVTAVEIDINRGYVATSDIHTQTYNGPVVLGIDTELNGININFNDTLNGNYNLTINDSGTTTFGGVVGGIDPLASITTDSPGTTNIGADLNTQGGTMTFNDPVNLTASVTLTDTGASGIAFNNTVDGPFNLTLISNGETDFNQAVGSADPIGTGIGPSLTINSSGTTTFNDTLNTASGITQDDAAGLIIFKEDVSVGAGNTASTFNANVRLSGMTFTANNALTFGNSSADDLRLFVDNITIRTLGGAGSTLTVNARVNGDNDLTLDTTGAAIFNAQVGDGTSIGDGTGAAITINSTAATTFVRTVNTSSGIEQGVGAGDITFRRDVTVDGGDAANNFNENVILDGLTFTSDQDITFGSSAANQLTLSTSAVAIDTSAGGANVTFNSKIDGNQDLTVNSGPGITTFNGVVGGTTPLFSITTDDGGETRIGADLSTQGGTMNFDDPVVLTADVTLTDTGATGIIFNSTLDGSSDLTISGNAEFHDQVGSSPGLALNSLDVTGLTTIDTTLIKTTGMQTYEDNVTLGSNDVNLDASTVSVGGLATFDPNGHTVTGNGILDVFGTLLVDAPTFAGNYTGFTTRTMEPGSTVNYSALTDQTIDDTFSYDNLTISGGGIKTAGGTLVVNGIFTILTPAKMALTVTAAPNTKVYDGLLIAAGIPTITAGLLATGDTGNFTETYDNKNVGTTHVLTPTGTITDAGSVDVTANYAITFTTIATGEITAKGLTVTGITANNKIFDGTTTATLNTVGADVEGRVGGDTVNLDTTGAVGTFATPDIGAGITVTISGLNLTGADAGNYALPTPQATTIADILPIPPAPTNTTTIISQLSTLENPRYPSPDMGQMTTYQINIVNPSAGGVYFYQPLTPYDMAAFNSMVLDANSYSFLNGSINLIGHEGLRSLFE